VCFDFLYNFCLKHFSFYEEFSNISQMYIGLHVKCPLFLSDFNETWIVSTYFWKIFRYQISWKSVRWESSCSMRTDGQTERQTGVTKLIVAFRNFANASKRTAWFGSKVAHMYDDTWSRTFPFITRIMMMTHVYNFLPILAILKITYFQSSAVYDSQNFFFPLHTLTPSPLISCWNPILSLHVKFYVFGN
jgi:hypothetical protein